MGRPGRRPLAAPQLEPVPGRCNARLRASSTGSQFCPNYPVKDRTRCRMHGGATPRLPRRLGERAARWQAIEEAARRLIRSEEH